MSIGSTRLASQPSPLSKSPHASGEIEDAKFYELAVTLTAGQVYQADLDATAFYVDDGPALSGEVEFTVDDCFPYMSLRYGMFIRMRRFKRITLRNISGASQLIHLIYSRNPEFLVLQMDT